MYSVQCVQCTVYSVYNVQCNVYIVHTYHILYSFSIVYMVDNTFVYDENTFVKFIMNKYILNVLHVLICIILIFNNFNASLIPNDCKFN